MPLPDLLRELLMTPGPSGHEGDAAAVFRRAAEPFAEAAVRLLAAFAGRIASASFQG